MYLIKVVVISNLSKKIFRKILQEHKYIQSHFYRLNFTEYLQPEKMLFTIPLKLICIIFLVSLKKILYINQINFSYE